jgi:hypothetical protein
VVKSNDYLSYLLRLWRAEKDGQNWHAMLQDVSTGEHVSFATLDDLFDFLRSELGISQASEQSTGSAGTDDRPGQL